MLASKIISPSNTREKHQSIDLSGQGESSLLLYILGVLSTSSMYKRGNKPVSSHASHGASQTHSWMPMTLLSPSRVRASLFSSIHSGTRNTCMRSHSSLWASNEILRPPSLLRLAGPSKLPFTREDFSSSCTFFSLRTQNGGKGSNLTPGRNLGKHGEQT